MKLKRYKLDIAPKGYTAYAEVRKVVPPKVKIEDAVNGLISFDAKKATKGKYQFQLIDDENHVLKLSLNIEVI